MNFTGFPKGIFGKFEKQHRSVWFDSADQAFKLRVIRNISFSEFNLSIY